MNLSTCSLIQVTTVLGDSCSKSLIGPQLRWPIIQKEDYAIFHCITKLQYLLLNRFFHLLTDHRDLTFVNDSVNVMVVGWKLAMMQFDFDVKHSSGIKNVVADLLSRLVKNHMETRIVGDTVKELIDPPPKGVQKAVDEVVLTVNYK